MSSAPSSVISFLLSTIDSSFGDRDESSFFSCRGRLPTRNGMDGQQNHHGKGPHGRSRHRGSQRAYCNEVWRSAAACACAALAQTTAAHGDVFLQSCLIFSFCRLFKSTSLRTISVCAGAPSSLRPFSTSEPLASLRKMRLRSLHASWQSEGFSFTAVQRAE